MMEGIPKTRTEVHLALYCRCGAKLDISEELRFLDMGRYEARCPECGLVYAHRPQFFSEDGTVAIWRPA